ncbi:MAG: hypothetical protein LBG20_02260 [Holosporaceae bacterium]|nr:hypothetical protein [Holosporaceae bacterium]
MTKLLQLTPCIAKKTFELAEKVGAILITQAKNNQKILDFFRNRRPSGNFCVAPVLGSSRTQSTLRSCAPWATKNSSELLGCERSLLKNQLEHGCIIQKPLESHEDEIDKNHVRIEKRRYEVFDASPMLDKWRNDWPYIRKVIRVTRFRQPISKKSIN